MTRAALLNPIFASLRAAMTRAMDAGIDPSEANEGCQAAIYTYGPGVMRLPPDCFGLCAGALDGLFQPEKK